jgi:carbon starvation protein CstA
MFGTKKVHKKGTRSIGLLPFIILAIFMLLIVTILALIFVYGNTTSTTEHNLFTQTTTIYNFAGNLSQFMQQHNLTCWRVIHLNAIYCGVIVNTST